MKSMNKTKDPKSALLDTIFQIEGVAEMLANGGPKAVNEALAKRGIQAKEKSLPPGDSFWLGALHRPTKAPVRQVVDLVAGDYIDLFGIVRTFDGKVKPKE